MRRFHTDRRLWLFASGCVFAALGFVDLTQGAAKERNTLWQTIAVAFEHLDHHYAPFVMAYHCVVLAVPAVMLGWTLQAVLVVLRERRRVSP